MQLEDLLKQLAGMQLEAGDLGDPEDLAQKHLQQNPHGAALFSSQALPGEESWRASDKARQAVLKGFEPKWSISISFKKYLLEVLDFTGQWVSPTAMAVRNATAVANEVPKPSPTHTFRQCLPPYEAVLGLETDGDGTFNLSLTLESQDEAITPLRLTVWDGDKRRAVQSGKGSVFVPGLSAGDYRVQVEASGKAIGDIDLEVKGA